MKHFKNPFIIILAILLVTILGCKKEKSGDNLEGKYNGFFIRDSNAPNIDPARATVEITFTRNEFSGSSNLRNYPAICHGSYTADKATLKVTNGCAFTADFDWSFIFDGAYQYSFDGKELRIWRDIADGRTDVYVLQKQ